MKGNKFILLILVLVLIISCESETEKPEMKITIGTVCGWCAGSDSLVISKSNTTYTLGAICDRKEKVISKQTSVSEWNELMALFDQRKFGAININSCDVCADGCDTWIRVENGSFKHEIRFGYEDSTILKPIKEFVERLETMKNHYK